MTHIEIIAVMALVPLGAWVAMGEGMVLRWWWNTAERLPAIIAKPLATCPRCMVSAWGIPAAFFTFPDINPCMLPVYVLAACGLQEMLHNP